VTVLPGIVPEIKNKKAGHLSAVFIKNKIDGRLTKGLHSGAHDIDIPSQRSTRPNTLAVHSQKAMQFINVVRSKPMGA
jgi:hypothetical protein